MKMDEVHLDFFTEYESGSEEYFAGIVATQPRCRLTAVRSVLECDPDQIIPNNTLYSAPLFTSNLTLVDNALFDGIQNSHESKVIEVICFGANVNAVNKNGNTPLMEACRKKFLDGRFDLVHCLLQNGANINCSSAHDGRTSLHFAVLNPNVLSCHNLVQFLLSCQANPDIPDHSGKTPLHYAVENGRIQVAQTILESSWTVVDRLDKNGRSPLSYACSIGNIAMVDLLLQYKASTTIMENGIPLIHIICKQGSTKVLLRILDKSNLEVTDEKGRTPLLVLCGEYVPLQCIEHALYLGANVNAVDLHGKSVLDIVRMASKPELESLLMKSLDASDCDHC